MKKFAHSRYFLPIEMALSPLSIIAGISGGYAPTALHAALEGLGMAHWWFWQFTVVGVARTAIAHLDWWRFKNAPERTVFRMASLRALFAGFCLLTWFGSIATLVANGIAVYGLFETLVGLFVMLPFNAWSFHENLMVRYALNQKVNTPNLTYAERRI